MLLASLEQPSSRSGLFRQFRDDNLLHEKSSAEQWRGVESRSKGPQDSRWSGFSGV